MNNVVALTVALDPNLPNVQVTQMTLMCDTAPNPLVLDLTGEWLISCPAALAHSSHSETGGHVLMLRQSKGPCGSVNQE